MTEERKKELRQLLEEAMKDLQIRNRFEDGNSSFSIAKYKDVLRQGLTFYSISVDISQNLIYLQYQPDIANEKTKSRLLEFIEGVS